MQICVSDIFLLKVLTKNVFYRIIIKVLFILRGVAQLVARQFWELDVAGSSPVTPTKTHTDEHTGVIAVWRNVFVITVSVK